MPIASDSTKLSIDFAYEWEGEQGKTTFPLRYVYGTFGPTIQIFFSEEQGVELPAEMFKEVSDFLIQQGVIRTNIPQVQATGGKPMAGPLLRRGGMLAPPQTQQAVNPLAPKVEPVTTLSNPAAESPPLSEEEIKAERLRARAKALSNIKAKVRSDHIEEE